MMRQTKQPRNSVHAYPNRPWVIINGRKVLNRSFSLEELQEIRPLVTQDVLNNTTAKQRTKLAGELLRRSIEKPKELSPEVQRMYDRNPGMHRDYRTVFDASKLSRLYDEDDVKDTDFDRPSYGSVKEMIAEKAKLLGKHILGSISSKKLDQQVKSDNKIEDILAITPETLIREETEFNLEANSQAVQKMNLRLLTDYVADPNAPLITEAEIVETVEQGGLIEQIEAYANQDNLS